MPCQPHRTQRMGEGLLARHPIPVRGVAHDRPISNGPPGRLVVGLPFFVCAAILVVALTITLLTLRQPIAAERVEAA
jgi:hypothetical protein